MKIENKKLTKIKNFGRKKLEYFFIHNKVAIFLCICFVIMFGIVIRENYKSDSIKTSSSNVSNKKIGWGIKRNNMHIQPDVGSNNKKILEENNGICLGDSEKKYIYLTFDSGYEAGYTPKILEVLKENEVIATFFITAHFVNSQPDLVKQMIDEGQIIGNQSPHSLMDL